jgi:hypothetical protein
MRLSPLGLFMKWFVLPLALAVCGYFFIGPHIPGAGAGSERQAPTTVTTEPTESVASVAKSEPEVDVSVKKQEPVRQRRHRRAKKAVEEQPVDEMAAPDGNSTSGDTPPDMGDKPAPDNGPSVGPPDDGGDNGDGGGQGGPPNVGPGEG